MVRRNEGAPPTDWIRFGVSMARQPVDGGSWAESAEDAIGTNSDRAALVPGGISRRHLVAYLRPEELAGTRWRSNIIKMENVGRSVAGRKSATEPPRRGLASWVSSLPDFSSGSRMPGWGIPLQRVQQRAPHPSDRGPTAPGQGVCPRHTQGRPGVPSRSPSHVPRALQATQAAWLARALSRPSRSRQSMWSLSLRPSRTALRLRAVAFWPG